MKAKSEGSPLRHVACEIRTDDLTRQLYATDASIYQVAPAAVAFPRSAAEAAAAIAAAAELGLPVSPRGAGTGLSGGALGEGMVVDFARYNREITDFDPERRTVRVGPGVVLDQLNDFARPHGLCFGPDVATSSRATLGGMIANNSSGARAPVYGTTAEHVVSLDVVLADGRVETVGAEHPGLAELRRDAAELVSRHAEAVDRYFPELLMKRWPGYGLDRFLRAPNDLCKIVAGSEGTLAGICSAELRLCPVPKGVKAVAVFFFDSVLEAMQATVEFLDLKPAAIEHTDRALLDQTRGQLAFKATRALLRLDEEPCESMLIVEFYDHAEAKAAHAVRRNVGTRRMVLTDARELAMVWGMRKAGLSLLTGRKGPAKPIAGIEDVAVRPEQLPDYVAGLQDLMRGLGLEASFYGHAASGLLHVRPIIDLHSAQSIAKYRRLADEVSALVRRFKGSLAAEHGVGIARTEYLPDHVGPELLEVMRALKRMFDPRNLLNPGKIIEDGHGYRIDTNLRLGAGYALELPFQPVLAFAAKDGSFIGNLEQCNGCGGCRKDTPTMCPTYIATGEEIMSTRGRANVIRAVLEGRLGREDAPLRSAELEEALGNCLSCKACGTECPSNVNIALLKAELAHARHRRHGVGPRDRMVAAIDLMNRVGCLAPRLANAVLEWHWVRVLMEWTLGFTAQRPLPRFATQRFDRWFAKRRPWQPKKPARGRVILWDDTFVRYNEPNIGQAAVHVLEAARYEVTLLEGRKCCGRPAFSVGRLDTARRLGRHNIDLIRARGGSEPIVFLEPSCYAMFAEDYRELGIDGAEEVAQRCFLFEQFVFDLLQRDPSALPLDGDVGAVAIHAHCHAKALTDVSVQENLARRLLTSEVTMLDTGCCGMAGQFGALASKYELSLKVADPLVDKINALKPTTRLVASGTSCRQQISHLTSFHPLHMAELVALALSHEES